MDSNDNFKSARSQNTCNYLTINIFKKNFNEFLPDTSDIILLFFSNIVGIKIEHLHPIEFLRMIAIPIYSVVEQPIINRVTAVRKHSWRLPETKTLNDCPYIISYESPRRLSSFSTS